MSYDQEGDGQDRADRVEGGPADGLGRLDFGREGRTAGAWGWGGGGAAAERQGGRAAEEPVQSDGVAGEGGWGLKVEPGVS